ncbi:hypothetical protein I4U23_022614 [Adineta vaga]|nr:hypothetical protein I4U23_022614 [Adineta vaga]
MEQQRQYHCAQPYDSYSASPFFIDLNAANKSENERSQSNADSNFRPIFIDLTAARRNQKPKPNKKRSILSQSQQSTTFYNI